MELKNSSTMGGPTKQSLDALKQHINNFLINYFGYFILVWVLIVLTGGLFIFVYPLYQKTTGGEGAVEQRLQTEYDNQAGYLRKIGDLKKLYKSISEGDRKKIEVMVPANDKIVNLILEIESIILRNGAFLDSIKLESAGVKSQAGANLNPGENSGLLAGAFAGQLPDGVGSVKIEVNLSSANYYVLKNIIRALENNLRLLDIAEVNYGAADDEASLTIYAYYLLRP
jgi:hypothetical protein